MSTNLFGPSSCCFAHGRKPTRSTPFPMRRRSVGRVRAVKSESWERRDGSGGGSLEPGLERVDHGAEPLHERGRRLARVDAVTTRPAPALFAQPEGRLLALGAVEDRL